MTAFFKNVSIEKMTISTPKCTIERQLDYAIAYTKFTSVTWQS